MSKRIPVKLHFLIVAMLVMVIGMVVVPLTIRAASTFYAAFNIGSLNADTGLGGTTATNDGTPATLVTGSGVFGQAAQILNGQTFKFPVAGNLPNDKGRISFNVKPSSYFNGTDAVTGKFYSPHGVYYDTASGYLYIADMNNNRIVKTKLDGTGWMTLGGGASGSGTGQFYNPRGIYYDATTGYIYVADTSNNRIVKTKIDGTGWTVYNTSLSSPYSVTYDAASSYLYIADTSSYRIVKTQIDGTGRVNYGTNGSGVGNFSSPMGITYDAATGDIYVADYGNSRIVKTKIDGTGWTTYGTSGSGTGQFSNLMGTAFDAATGFIYVADYGNSRIVKTKIDGTGWTTYGSYGSGSGQFAYLYGLSIDTATGNIYVADYSNNRIVRTQIDGASWTTYGSLGYMGGVLRSPVGVYYDVVSGYYYITDSGNGRIVRTKLDGTGWSILGSSGAWASQFNSPSGIDYDASTGFLYIADTSNNRIVKTKFDGTGWTTYGTSGSSTGNFSAPRGVVYDASTGFLYVADTGNSRIVKTKINGSGWTTYGTGGVGTGKFSSPYGLTYNPATGDIYVADYGNHRIVKTKIDGTGWATFGTYGSGVGNFNNPIAVAFDAATSEIYVSDYINSRIVKTKIDGTGWTTYGSSGTTVGLFTNQMGIQYVPSTHTLYVADTSNNRIEQLVTTNFGDLYGTVGGANANQFNAPRGYDYDASSGYYYIADTGNYRIVKTKLDGTGWTAYGTYCSSSCTAAGQFNLPVDVVYDAANDLVYVLEGGSSYGSKIIKTKMDGSVWSSYGSYSSTQGTGKFYTPNGFDYDPATGYFYVANSKSGATRPGVIKTKFDGTGWTDYGGYGSGTGQFSTPTDVSYDPASDYLYIADYGNNRIVKTKIDGTGWTVYGTNGSSIGNFSGPRSVDYDAASDYIYVADASNSRIVKTKIDGTGWKSYASGGASRLHGGLYTPYHIMFNATAGKVSVADTSNSRMVTIDTVGTDWTAYGTVGSGTGNFSSPYDVSYDAASGYMYIADYTNNRIIKTQIDGTGWTAYGTSGSGTGNFSNPNGIWYDAASDYIYVTDRGNNRIVKTKIDGTGWTAYGTSGSGTGNFSTPQGIYYDAASTYIYVADTGNNRIVKTQINGTGWAAYGTVGANIGNFSGPNGIWYDAASEFIYVADSTNGRVVKTKIDGTGWTSYGGYNTTYAEGRLYYTGGKLTYDASTGMIYIASKTAHRIIKFKIDGSYWTSFGYGTSGSAQEAFSSPLGVFYDATSGYTYVADSANNRIVKVGLGNDNWTSLGSDYYTATGVLSTPMGTYYDPASQYLYIADSANNRIVKTKLDGTGWTSLGGPAPANGSYNFNAPSDVFYDAASGYLYVTDTGNYRIIKTKIDGTGWTAYGAQGSGSGQFRAPRGIYYDAASDYIYTVDYYSSSLSRVVKTKIDGTGWTTYGTYGTGTGNLKNPRGVWYDAASSYLYIADTGNNRIVKTQIDGTGFTTYGTTGSGAGNFSSPYAINYDAVTGYIYVSDYGNNRTVKTTIDGTGWATTTGLPGPYVAFRDPTTDLIYTPAGNHIYRYTFGYPYAPTTTAPKEVLLMSQGDGMRLELDPTSSVLTFWPAYTTASDAFVRSSVLTWSSGDWHTVTAWFNQSTSQLSLQTDTDTVVSATASWALPSYGTSFYLGSDPSNTYNALGGAIDNVSIVSVDNDTTAPTNPTSTSGSSASGGTAISDGTGGAHWYNYTGTGPYFSWSGAADADSDVAGYYVYFGTSSSADPATLGTWQTTTTYTNTATLVSGATYYLRVITKDNSNNVSAAATLYTYNYDGTAPTLIDHVTPDPTGCSVSSSFTMSWPAATDAHSTIAGYDYKVGPSGDIVSTIGLSATVANYQTGLNYFYVRSRDAAGNVSGWQSGTFCYTTDADPPTNPTTVSAVNADGGSTALTSNNWYNHANPKFTWTGATDNGTVAGYYVYFGTNPSADPATDGTYQTGSSYIAGTLSNGSTYYLIIKAKDSADNAAASGWTGFIYKYSTAKPTNPTALTAQSTSGGSAITTATWYNHTAPYFAWTGAGGGRGIAGYYVYFGTDGAANPVEVGTYQVAANYSAAPTVSGSTYHLRVVAKDVAGNTADAIWEPFAYKLDNAAPSIPDHVDVSPIGCSYSDPYTFTWAASSDGASGLSSYEYKNGPSGDVASISGLTQSATHYQDGGNYFYVRATDTAGNTSDWQSVPYCYAIDATTPTNPSSISALNAAGGSTTLASGSWYNYAAPKFSWSGASDNTGVAGYYVYFGTNPNANPITDGAYQAAANSSYTAGSLSSGSTYYLRVTTLDIANLPASSAWTAFTYKYSTDAPTNPSAVTGVDSVGGSTELTEGTWYNYAAPSFSWTGADGGQGIAGYYVYYGTDANADPAVSGTYQTSATYTAANMTSGSTYYLRLKSKDNAGNTSGTTWSATSYKYDGTAPSSPDYISATPQGCSTASTFTFSWAAITDNESGLAGYDYKKGSTGEVLPTTALSIDLSAYQEGDNIAYVRSRDNAGNTSSWQAVVFCSTGVVHVTSGPHVTLAATSIVVDWVTDKRSTSYISVNEGNTYVSGQGHNEYATSHSVQVIGLKAQHSYTYKLSWTDTNGNLGETEWYSIETAEPPSIVNPVAQVLSPTSALVSWSTTINADSSVEYGTTAFDTSISTGNGSSFSTQLSDLKSGAVYQFRIKAISSQDEFEFFGQGTFSTPPLPEINDVLFSIDSDQASMSEKVTWKTNVETTSSVYYGLPGEAKKELTVSDKTKDHVITIPNLLDNSEYEVYVTGTDSYGNTVRSNQLSLKTPVDVRPPVVTGLTIETSNIGLDQQDKAQMVVTWKTDKPSSSQVEYDQGVSGSDYRFRTNTDPAMVDSHIVVITGLEPNVPHHVRALSVDKNGNIGKSSDTAVVSGEVQQSVFTNIMDTIQSLFGWLHLFGGK